MRLSLILTRLICFFFLSSYQRTSNGHPTDPNFEPNEEGINLQAMDNSHVALAAVKLLAMPLGVNLTSITKVLECAKDDDVKACG